MYKRYWLRVFAILMFGWVSTVAMAASPRLVDVQVKPDTDTTRLTIELSQAVSYKIFTLAGPDRLVIDLPDAVTAASFDHLQFTNTQIVRLRKGRPVPQVLRIVFDLRKPQYPHVIAQPVAKDGSQQIIVDLVDPGLKGSLEATPIPAAAILPASPSPTELKPEPKPQVKSAPLPEIPTAQPVAKPEVQPKPEPKPELKPESRPEAATPTPLVAALSRPIVIVIDPGHGGKDPGARGSLGVREKDVVLAIGKELYRLLHREEGFRPVLTRRADSFVGLRKRLSIARQARGDLFVAIHADAYRDAYTVGASVYALSAHGASSEAVRWLAEKENHSELGGVELKDKSDVVRSVLLDLSQTATITTSLQLGHCILHQLGKVGHLHCSRVEQAPFVVLKSPDIPSLLIETGFLSNPHEERRLRDPAYQRRIAAAIFDGIRHYYWKSPPPGTLIATLQAKKQYGAS